MLCAAASHAGEPVITNGGVVKIGVLTDMSSIFSDIGGKGSVIAAQMAADDFGGKVNGVPIKVISADHQNKTDVAATVARDWFDNQHVDMVEDLLPSSVALAGDVLVALGFLAVAFVFRENSFSSATIELASNQKVISSGPYAWVRHPMYAGGLVMLLGIPVALGSWWGLAVAIAIIPALIWRLIDEERFLGHNLPGYAEYRHKVRYRLIPLLW